MGIKCIGDTKVAVSIQSLPFKPEGGRQNRGDVVVELTYIFIADPDERECLFVDGFVLIGVTEKNMVFAVREDGDQVKTTKEKMLKLCDSALNRAKQMDSILNLYFKDSRLL
uniref:Exoribonuclease phosphorolytic domain-containing protein n=1 Tax=Panagrolaimus davidi TaxID=227884 RepID=A0A914QH65_9BILA